MAFNEMLSEIHQGQPPCERQPLESGCGEHVCQAASSPAVGGCNFAFHYLLDQSCGGGSGDEQLICRYLTILRQDLCENPPPISPEYVFTKIGTVREKTTRAVVGKMLVVMVKPPKGLPSSFEAFFAPDATREATENAARDMAIRIRDLLTGSRGGAET